MSNHRVLNFDDQRKNVEERLAFIKANLHPIVLVLDHIQNPRNIGAIFRLAEAARVKKIVLFQADLEVNEKKFQRAARSASSYVEYEIVNAITPLKEILSAYQILALEKTNQSKSYADFRPNETKEIALIVGNEILGVSSKLLDICESAIHIPMFGLNTSMNVVTATGIVLFDLLQKKTSFNEQQYNEQ